MSETKTDSSSFEPGDVVELKSGGPGMTVIAVKDDGVHCLWYAEMSDEVKTAVIPAICLARLEDEDDEDDEDEDEDEDEDD